MRTLFTADLHFGHDNIIAYCHRPFADTDAMDRAMIQNWNCAVDRRDRVIVIGDFAVNVDQKRLRTIFDSLNGQKFLVIGNHDAPATRALPWAASPRDIMQIEVEGQRIVCCHFAMRTWPGVNRGAIHLFGHSHRRLPGDSLSLDVGVDCWDFQPVDLKQITARLLASPRSSDHNTPAPNAPISP